MTGEKRLLHEFTQQANKDAGPSELDHYRGAQHTHCTVMTDTDVDDI